MQILTKDITLVSDKGNLKLKVENEKFDGAGRFNNIKFKAPDNIASK